MAEEAFVKSFLNTLSSQTVVYPDEYQQSPEKSLRKVPVLPVQLPPPPQRAATASSSSSASISVTFKSLKPAASFTIDVQPTDSISSIKEQLSKVDRAPPADAQRLLLKGKALADGKLLQEYSVKQGDTINLVLKPGFDWDPTKSEPSPASSSMDFSTSKLDPDAVASSRPKKHQRIPSVVLSPSPSATDTPGAPMDITLTLDNAPNSMSSTEDISLYHATLASPEFWDRLNLFLKSQFENETDALHVFEDFLRASKGALTANEIAKIRDHVGVIGMAGT